MPFFNNGPALESLDVIINKFRTARVQHTVTPTEASNFQALVDIVWDVPFTDSNYTVVASLEAPVPLIPTTINTEGLVKSPTKVTIAVNFTGNGALIVAGNVFVLHAIAIHD